MSPTPLLLLSLLVLAFLLASASSSPGHMQHQYYKDQEENRQRLRNHRGAEWGDGRSSSGDRAAPLVALLGLAVWALLE